MFEGWIAQWLRANRYVPERVTLCWGDARLPNTIFTPEGDVLALLDWDMAILSDPVSDLAFVIVMDWLLGTGLGVPRLEGFPGKEETLRHYEEVSGWKVKNFFYNEVFAVLRAGIVILRVQKNLERMGIPLPGEDPMRDNMCTRRLADLLGLPSPSGTQAAKPGADDTSGDESPEIVQLRVTGPAGGDWYVESRAGVVTCRRGKAEASDATLVASAEDWQAIQNGTMDRFNAWTSGRLQVTGDGGVYQRLAEDIGKAWDAAGTNKNE